MNGKELVNKTKVKSFIKTWKKNNKKNFSPALFKSTATNVCHISKLKSWF